MNKENTTNNKFNISPPTVQEINLKKEKEACRRKAFLERVPSTAGIYILTFPNGKKLIGSSKNLKSRITHLLNDLIPLKLKTGRQPQIQWQIQALKENKLTCLKDLRIVWKITNNAKAVEKQMLEKIRNKEMYYNK